MNFETEKVEFKSRFTEDIYKETVAFANSEGGTIFVGIDDCGNITGLSDADKEFTRITNGIRDAISPDVTMFVRYHISEDGVLQITVSEGTNKPYYLKSKGLKPSGVFVRQGTSGVQATQEQIRRMIKESDGDDYESARSVEQNLTFDDAKAAFLHYGVDFGEEKYRTLGLEKNGNFTNLALLLSDQCVHSTKIAVFDDDACTVFRDSKEFKGSVFKQFESAVNYLALCNKTVSMIKGVVRNDKKDYPEEAIREALLNAFVHRDYSFSGSIIINVNADKMEFISLGGLVPGLSVEDIKIGISQPRNEKLAEIFHRLRLVESYGTGVRRIFKLYESLRAQPQIEVSANAFKMVLPNMNGSSVAPVTTYVTDQMQKLIDFVSENGETTDSEIGELLNIKKTRVYTLTREMSDLRLIRINGRGKNKTYTVGEED